MRWEPGGRWAGLPASLAPLCAVPATVSPRSLYTCVLEAAVHREARKWLQLAVFCSPLAAGQSHLQLRVYFLNNTPCALRWAVTNEQPHGGRLRGPCQLFDFTGARGDQCLKLKYISEGEGDRARHGASGSPLEGRVCASPVVETWGVEFLFEIPGQAAASRGPSGSCCCLLETPAFPLPPSAAHGAPVLPWEASRVRWVVRGEALHQQGQGESEGLLLSHLDGAGVGGGGPVFSSLVPLWVGCGN